MRRGAHAEPTRSATLLARVSSTVTGRARTVRGDLVARAERMRHSAATRRGTRKRALVAAGVGFAALGAMFQLVSENVLAVNFTTANNSFSLYSN